MQYFPPLWWLFSSCCMCVSVHAMFCPSYPINISKWSTVASGFSIKHNNLLIDSPIVFAFTPSLIFFPFTLSHYFSHNLSSPFLSMVSLRLLRGSFGRPALVSNTGMSRWTDWCILLDREVSWVVSEVLWCVKLSVEQVPLSNSLSFLHSLSCFRSDSLLPSLSLSQREDSHLEAQGIRLYVGPPYEAQAYTCTIRGARERGRRRGRERMSRRT